jgi:phosphoglucan,water dikinase
MAVYNLEMSQFQLSECQAIASELASWRHQFALENPRHRMRLKASLDRCQRLAQAYCDKVLALFFEKAQELGKALGVSRNGIQVFCEADIRSHLVFQLSRALDVLLKSLRKLDGISPWDVVVMGKAFGRLHERFDAEALPVDAKDPIVLLLEKVEEEEAMPEAVVGIIATQAIPHLSHLAIRLRHRRLPCVVCEDKDLFTELKSLTGKQVLLEVSEGQVTIRAANITKKNDTKDRYKGIQKPDSNPSIKLSSAPCLLPLDAIDLSTGGGKAFKAKGLKAISDKTGSDFEVPRGVVVPFGIMEAALRADPMLEKSYLTKINRLKSLHEPALSATLEGLRKMVENLKVPEAIASGVTRDLPTSGPVVVRSSANSEDLKGSTTAGVYDTIVNVPPSAVAKAVGKVWASLWSKRAYMARQRQGIPCEQSHMAVLIQPMVVPEYAFVMHTVNPMNNHGQEIYMELAVGMGQTLASGDIPGSPYRVICNKHTEKVRVLAYASFSQSLVPGRPESLVKETLDYGTIPLSVDENLLKRTARRLSSIGQRIETAMGGPQDIEGVIQNNKIYLVQTRPQMALALGTGSRRKP